MPVIAESAGRLGRRQGASVVASVPIRARGFIRHLFHWPHSRVLSQGGRVRAGEVEGCRRVNRRLFGLPEGALRVSDWSGERLGPRCAGPTARVWGLGWPSIASEGRFGAQPGRAGAPHEGAAWICGSAGQGAGAGQGTGGPGRFCYHPTETGNTFGNKIERPKGRASIYLSIFSKYLIIKKKKKKKAR